MRVVLALVCLAFLSVLPTAAQTFCDASSLHNAAAQVMRIREQLHKQAVTEADPVIPETVIKQLFELKDALTAAARASFACASPADAPEKLQASLAEALHADLAVAESTVETRGKQDVGAYGSNLAVQIFELSKKPRLLEVDFRYGLECGDDNLLLIFEGTEGAEAAASGWHERLRWDATKYHTVADALGDFILLTPLTGSHEKPTWRYVVAHGQPGCADSPRPSTFDLDLLTPTADPAKPVVSWHFEHPYTQDARVPRLTTTEDTLDFRLRPAPPVDSSKNPGETASEKQTAPSTDEGSAKSEIYRFHLTPSGQMEPLHQP